MLSNTVSDGSEMTDASECSRMRLGACSHANNGANPSCSRIKSARMRQDCPSQRLTQVGEAEGFTICGHSNPSADDEDAARKVSFVGAQGRASTP